MAPKPVVFLPPLKGQCGAAKKARNKQANESARGDPGLCCHLAAVFSQVWDRYHTTGIAGPAPAQVVHYTTMLRHRDSSNFPCHPPSSSQDTGCDLHDHVYASYFKDLISSIVLLTTLPHHHYSCTYPLFVFLIYYLPIHTCLFGTLPPPTFPSSATPPTTPSLVPETTKHRVG